MDRQDFTVFAFCWWEVVAQLYPPPTASVFILQFAPGILHQYTPHSFGRGPEKVAAIGELLLFGFVNETEIRFMHQGGGIQRLSWFLACHLPRGDAAKLGIHQRKQLFGGARLTAFDGAEQT